MKLFVTYLLLMAFGFSQAQMRTDSVITLPEVEKISNAVVVTVQSPITSYKFISSKNLNEVLRENAGLYLKNYGNGQLASITIRGTSASQTDLLWNGVKLNSPALGQVDLSLFNMGMSDQLEFGGISQFGNVGGFINLKNDNYVDSAFFLNASFSYGSFHSLRAYGKARYGNGKFSGTTRLSYLTSENDYRFINTYKPGHPKENLTHAKVQLLSFMQQFNAQVNANNSIQFNLWLSDAQRLIPPIVSRDVSRESQDDYSLRSALSWKGKFKKISAGFTSALLHDAIHYKSPDISLDDKSIMQASRNNFTLTYDSLKRFSVTVEAGYDFERAVVPSYTQIRNRHIGRLKAIVKYEPVNEVLLQLSLREQLYDKVLSPFSPMLLVRYQKHIAYRHNIVLHANASRNFRFPTLNELYWKPGGNPDLKTEKNLDAEAGFSYWYSSYFNFKATGFCKYVDNWIQWNPTGPGYWEPANVKRVLSRGVELSAKLEGPFRFNSEFNFALSVNYTYTRATNLNTLSPFDQSKGKQLIYVPLHVANALVHMEYKKFYLRAGNTYTGAVFISTDNSKNLKGYYLLDLEIGKDFIITRYEVGIAFRVNNVTDTQYQTIAQRPMPGRGLEGTIRFKLS